MKHLGTAMAMAMAMTATLAACTPEPEAWVWDLPPGFPEPFVPEDNPMSTAKVELGRHLFYDERLSHNQTMACATCHEQELAFTDGLATTEGSTGHALTRSSMSLTNVAYYSIFTWANPKLADLEAQALVPIFADFPLELGVALDPPAVLQRFADDPEYQTLFAAAFPDDPNPVTAARIAQALASFQRTLISGNSPYDHYIYRDDRTALSDSAIRGMELFFSEKAECYHCHAGINFSTAFRSATTDAGAPDFHNNGLYHLDADGAYPTGNGGLFEFTGDPRDHGKFRVPSLRNVAVTAPYMHDGSIETLEEVLDHYAAGGREVSDGPWAGDGRQNPNKSTLIRPFTLSDQEKADLLAFLHSLTDEEFLTDPRFGPP